MLTAVLVAAVSASAAQAQKGKGPDYGLWVLNTFFITEFQGTDLVKGGVRKPRILFGVRDLYTPVGIAWDNQQNLWLSFDDIGGEIVRLTPRQVQALSSGHGVKVQNVVLLQDSMSYYPFYDPSDIGFDKEGNLWVIDSPISSLMEFTPDQIATSGAPTPAVWIRAGRFIEPAKMRFDASDNLWVEWQIGQPSGVDVDELARFSPKDRTASGPPNPSLILDIPLSNGLDDFAFDGQGNLWIANASATSPFETVELTMVPQDQIAGSGEITVSPTITIGLPEFAQGLCVDYLTLDFDPLGALWVSGSPDVTDCNQFEQVDEFTPEQLISSGTATSSVRLRPNRRETNFRAPHLVRVGPAIH